MNVKCCAVIYCIGILTGFSQEVKIEKNIVGAKISGVVPSSEQCYVGKVGEKTILQGPNKGKTVKTVVVDYSQGEKGLWLGITAIINGEEIDYACVKVEGHFAHDAPVSLIKLFDTSTNPLDVTWVARLWGAKVPADICPYMSGHNGQPCKYCKKNGYHMERPIAEARK